MNRIRMIAIALVVAGCAGDDAAVPAPGAGSRVADDTVEMAPPDEDAPAPPPVETIQRLLPSPAIPGLYVPDYPSIVIDGRAEDWADLPWAAEGIKIAEDPESLFILLDVGKELALDESAESPTLYLDADDDPTTGAAYDGIGVELLFAFGKRSGTLYEEASGTSITHWDIGLVALPTVSAQVFEVSIDRAALPLGKTLTMELMGRRLTYRMGTHASRPPLPVPLGKADPEAIRLMTWNMRQDGLLDPGREEAFRTVLLQIRPDIMAFQEVWSGPEAVRARIATILQHPDDDEWSVHGHKGRVVVSRYPILEGWPDDFDTLDSRFEVVGLLLPDDRRFILVNAHLTCCADDAARLLEATSFLTWVDDVVTPGGDVDAPLGSPIVLVGDLNLVGSAQPLEVLLSAPDWSGGTLEDLRSRHADRPAAYTWRHPGGDFWPGRLDYVIYSADMLTPLRHFVVPESVETTAASDHLPRVVDFALNLVVPSGRSGDPDGR